MNMQNNKILITKLEDIIDSINLGNSVRAKDIAVNAIQYCKSNELKRDKRIIENNINEGKKLAREIHYLTEHEGLSGNKLEQLLKEPKTWRGFV